MAETTGAQGQGEHHGARDFLNPNSMLTPGLAGGMTMLITNTVCQWFPLKPAEVGLAVSFMFGLLVLAMAAPWWKRGVYYLLNSLIIFCVAAGASGFGAAAAIGRPPQPAAPAVTTAPPPPPPVRTAELEERERIEAMIRELQGRLGQPRSAAPTLPAPAPAAGPQAADEPFFRRWF
jgi:hypothetical protein